MHELLLQGIRSGFRSVRISAAFTVILWGPTAWGQSQSMECPGPLSPMPRFADAPSGGLIHVHSGTRTDTREVQAEYHRSVSDADRIADVGFVVLTNHSNRRRMIRYHHSWLICPRPRHVAGSVHFSGGITGSAWFDCNRIREGAVDRNFEHPQSKWQLQVEVALAPGETIEGWWVANFEYSDFEYCDADLNHDGQVDEADLAIGLGGFGTSADQRIIRMIIEGMCG